MAGSQFVERLRRDWQRWGVRLALGVAGVYLVIAWSLVVAVDFHDLFGVRQWLIESPHLRPILWVNLFVEAGPTEWLQWLALGLGSAICFHAWLVSRQAGDGRLASAWFFLGVGAVLMLIEDALNLRHVFAEEYVFGTRQADFLGGTLFELAVFGVIGMLMLVPMAALLWMLRPGRRTLGLVIVAYAAYAVVGGASALRHVGELHLRVGTWFVELWSLDQSEHLIAYGEGVVEQVDIAGMDTPVAGLAYLFMDMPVEESVELVAAALLLAALIALHAVAVRAMAAAASDGPRRPAPATVDAGAAEENTSVSNASTVVAGLGAIAIVIAHANQQGSWTLVALAWLPLLLAVVVALWHARGGVTLGIGPGGILLGALVLWQSAGLAWSEVTGATLMAIATTAAALTVYLLWRIHAAAVRPPIAMVLGTFAVLGALLALAAIGQRLVLDHGRLLFWEPTLTAAMLNALWPAAALAVVLATPGARALRGASLAVLALMAVALGVNVEVGSAFAAFAALIVIVLYAKYTRCGRSDVLSVAVIVPAGIGGGHILQWVLGADPRLGMAEFGAIWPAVMAMLWEAPLLGWGAGLFENAFPLYRAAHDGSMGLHAHNDYLQAWVEWGIPGLLLLLALLVAALLPMLRPLVSRSVERPAAAVGAATALSGAVAAGVATHALAGAPLQAWPVWLLLAWSLAEAERHRDAGRFVLALDIRDLRRPVAATTAVAMVVLPAIALLAAHSANRAANNGAVQLIQAQVVAAESSFNRAATRFPWIPGLYRDRAFLWMGYAASTDDEDGELEYIDRARADLERAEAMNPHDWRPHAARGHLHRYHGHIAEGDVHEAYERALALDPRAVQARVEYAQYLRAEGLLDEALDVLEAWLELEYGRYDVEGLHDGIEAIEEERRSGEDEGDAAE